MTERLGDQRMQQVLRGHNDIVRHHVAVQGGEILVSSLLKELTDSAGDIQFGEVQEVELKGLAGLNRVYAVAWE